MRKIAFSQRFQAKLHEIIFEADTSAGKVFDVLLIVSIAASVVMVMLDSVSSIRLTYGDLLYLGEWIFTLLFTIEYVLRLYCVGRPLAYATSFFGLVDLLAVLKHPLAAGGRSTQDFRRLVRLLEIKALRGPRPAPGFDGLKRALRQAEKAPKELTGWLAEIAELANPFIKALKARRRDPAGIVGAHIRFAEALAANDQATGAERLWSQEAGEVAAAFMSELREAAAHGPKLSGERYAALLTALMASQVVRPRYGRHPRLAILGPLEARLQHFGLLILGGLNEGTWPAQVDPGPWLSRP